MPQGQALSAKSAMEAREGHQRRDEISHSRLSRAFLAPSGVLMSPGAESLVFVGLSAILPLLHAYSYTFKTLKES